MINYLNYKLYFSLTCRVKYLFKIECKDKCSLYKSLYIESHLYLISWSERHGSMDGDKLLGLYTLDIGFNQITNSISLLRSLSLFLSCSYYQLTPVLLT